MNGFVTDRQGVQAAVDRLAEEVGCPVLVEDSRHQPLWWSAQVEVDPVRLQTLLERSVAPEAAAMVRQLQLAQSMSPVRTPEVPKIGMRERWCVAVRFEGRHLGYLWVVDGDGRVPESMLPRLESCAELAGRVMASTLLSGAERSRQRDALLSRLRVTRDESAARDLIDLEQLPHDVRIVVWQPSRDGGWLLPRAETDEASVHVAGRPGHAREHSDATSGSPVPLVDLAKAVHRADATRRVVMAGARLSTPSWDALGPWRLIVDADNDLTPDDLHPGVSLLLSQADSAMPSWSSVLLETARSVVDHGGDVAAAAAELHIHRTTLYYRLDRIAAICGVNLREGSARTDLQMALWLAAYRAAR